MNRIFLILQWAWGEPLGKFVAVRSWRPSLDWNSRDWRNWGIAWPTYLADHCGRRSTDSPIWNWIWLRNRLGFEKTHGWS